MKFTGNAKVFGLTIGRTRIGRHIKETISKRNIAPEELHRFSSLPTNIKAHLLKAYVLPIMQYPPIPLIIISKPKKL